jgi:hypothetical protein
LNKIFQQLVSVLKALEANDEHRNDGVIDVLLRGNRILSYESYDSVNALDLGNQAGFSLDCG